MSATTIVTLPAELHSALAQHGLATGRSVQELVEEACHLLLSSATYPQQQQEGAVDDCSDALPLVLRSQESVPSLYMNQPILTIVDGLLHGEQTVQEALRHGNFGLGKQHLHAVVTAFVVC